MDLRKGVLIMSSYCKEVVIRCKVDMNKLGVSSLWDLEDKFPDLFDIRSCINHFEKAPVEEENYLDFILEYDSDSCGEYGFSRELTDDEAVKYLTMFSQIYPDVCRDDLRYVTFCWYNCTEAPLYF